MPLVDCLSDWIGLRGTCTAETPGSGLYINDLPRINIQFMENLGNREAETFVDVWEKVERRALATFGSKVRTMLRNSLDFRTIASSVSTGEWNNDGSLIQGSILNNYGYKIEVVKSKYMSLYLNYINFYSDAAVSIPIRVYNLSSGEQLYAINFSASIGVNTFNINQEFSLENTESLFIGFVQTAAFQGIRVEENIYFNQGKQFYTQTFGAIPTASDKIENNFQGGGIDSSMIIANFTLKCSMDNYICQHRDALTLALWYWCGYEFMSEWLGALESDNINWDTLQDPQRVIDWKNYLKGKAEGELKSVLNSIEPDFDGVCFECAPQIVGTYHLP